MHSDLGFVIIFTDPVTFADFRIESDQFFVVEQLLGVYVIHRNCHEEVVGYV